MPPQPATRYQRTTRDVYAIEIRSGGKWRAFDEGDTPDQAREKITEHQAQQPAPKLRFVKRRKRNPKP